MEPHKEGTRARSRGRAQHVPQQVPQHETPESSRPRSANSSSSGGNGSGNGSPGSGNGNGGNGNGNGSGDDGNGAAIRGRGGYRARSGDIVTRPENITTTYGDRGTQIDLVTNYFSLTLPSDAVVQKYRVDFDPNIEASRLRREMVISIRDLLNNAYVFDGQNEIRTIKRLPEDLTHRMVKRPGDESMVTLTLKRTGEIGWGSMEMMQLYNTQMRRNFLHLHYVLMGRNYFDPNSKMEMPQHHITLMPGFITAIAQHDGGILMVVNSAVKFIRSDTVFQVLGQIRKGGGEWMNEARKELCGSIVMTKYNNRTYRIEDIEHGQGKTPDSYYFDFKGQRINLVTYYKNRWDVVISQPKQPLIMCRPSEREIRSGLSDNMYLIPELCVMTGLTNQMRSNPGLMREIDITSRLDPNSRCRKLQMFIKSLRNNPAVTEEMNKWRMAYDDNLVKLTGRILPREMIYMEGGTEDRNGFEYDQKSADFSRGMRSKRLFLPMNFPNWVILVGPRDNDIVRDFSDTLNRVCGPMGMRLSRPQVEVLQQESTASWVVMCRGFQRQNVEFVVCIVPNENKDRYDAIKKILCCENPIPSQIIKKNTLMNKQRFMSVCTKIGVQMACKMGGEAWAVRIPPKDLMVIGYDTYHDSAKKNLSAGGFVASMNPLLTSWYSRVTYHINQQEMSSHFATNLTEAIKYFHSKNGRLPQRIIIYRDGVGEGMIQHVFDHELKQITDAIGKMFASNPPLLSFIIVTKRINTRFFVKTDRNYENPPPGTVVDKVVTRPNRYDFFLVSQSVRQGTVTPTMYNIIYDTSNWNPNNHQQLAYKLTHLYFNWPGTIRVPAPCQYAHKLAYLTGTSLHREPSATLSGQLFYL